jgi:rhamnogalacturonan endolyase
MKLNDFFDWMLNDAKRNKLYLKTDRENKYNYTANQFENRAFGWASTTEGIGCFLINASMEYMSGGPTKIEFLCHRDTNQVAAPCVLNYWRSSHYGGAMVAVAEGEHWTKVIGPFMIYCNQGSDPQAILRDAQARQIAESSKWPYSWVDVSAYPNKDERGSVKGKLVLNDPLMPDGAKMTNVMVGLTHPDYQIPYGNSNRSIGWQQDAKYYQFWIRSNDDGTFVISNVHPGSYTLRAYADGVLGEFAKSDVSIESGKILDLGSLVWTPVRRGRQLWDIGIPNRNSREFLKGDDYYHDGMQELYAELFPNNVHYDVGKSDYRKDVYYQHVPRPTAESLKAAREYTGSPFRAPRIDGMATPWTILFDMSQAPAGGKATLRLAISGTRTRTIAVAVNEQSAGEVVLASGDSTFSGRNGIQGIWYERELVFDATMLKAGSNNLTLNIPAGAIGNGVMYDYLRLELDELTQ